MFCPIRSLCPQISNVCTEKKCAFWYNGECVITGFLRGFVKGEAPMRDEPGM
ncbi:MAG: hypothetical protein KAW40_05860 [Candidatus Aenigmarchaeota archaeon]|nr:hypothetical protein [Candidatus Aenigmarchaeota archaeon]